MPRRSVILLGVLLSAAVLLGKPLFSKAAAAASAPISAPGDSTSGVAMPTVASGDSTLGVISPGSGDSTSGAATSADLSSSAGPADSTRLSWWSAEELAAVRDSFVVRGAQSRFTLSHSQIGDSQKVWLDGRLLAQWQEYRIDRTRGVLLLEHPAREEASLVVAYHFNPTAAPQRVQLHSLRRPQAAETGTAGETPISPGVGEETREEALSEGPSSEGLQVRGSKTVSVQGGTNREATVDQGLHLEITGRITENTYVRAEISDENLPITPEGNTEELQDIDQVRIELLGPRGSAVLGDFQLLQPLGIFVPYQRKLQGLWLHGRDPHGTASVLAGSPRGERKEIELRGREGVQGPYELLNGLRDDESFIVAGTERVWVDGQPQVRGENNQYTIDYIRGTITFTQARPVGPDNRIAADFEVSSTGYTRTVVGAMVDSLRMGPLKFHVSWIREADDSSRPLGGPLSAEDEDALRAAGDDPDQALGSGITQVPPGDEGSGDYALRDSLSIEFYVYAPGDSMANYFLNFERVGEGKGDYLQSDVDAKGRRIYKYVGQGVGDHRIGRRLPMPSSTEAAVIGLNLGSQNQEKEGFLAVEADFTRRDENTLSPLDEENNDGMAWRVQGATGWMLSSQEAMGVRIRGSAEGIDPKFHELGRIRIPFFYDAWNLQDQKRDQWEGHETLEMLVRDATHRSNMSVERLHRHGGYDGARGRWSAAGPIAGPLNWRHDLAFMRHQGKGSEGHRRDRSARMGLDLGEVEPYLRWVDERFDDGPSVSKRGFQSQEWGAGILSSHAIADGSLEYRRRLADSLSTDGTQWRFQQDLREWRAVAEGLASNVHWKLDGTWRESRLDGGVDETTRLGRLGLGWRPAGRSIGADLEYRAGNDRSRVIQRKIVFVGERQGDYDQEGNRLGKNLGDYSVIFSAGDSLTAAVDVRLASKFDLQWLSAPLVGGLSFNGQFTVEERSQSDDIRRVLTLDPGVLRNAATTIFGQQVVRADLTLLRRNRKIDLRLSYDETDALDRRFSSIPERSYRRERIIRVDRDLTRGWALRLDGGDADRVRSADPSSGSFLNSYQVKDFFGGGELSYRPTARTRAGLQGRATSRDDGFSGIAQKVWELTPLVTTDFLRGRWTTEFRWARVSEDGGDPLRRPYFFERPGDNRRFSVIAQWALGKVLTFTVRYQLRDEAERNPLHDLSVETRARF